MSVIPKGEFESLRELPGWDKAEQLFSIRYKYAVSHAHGMERFAFAVLPYSLIRSFALTFDPREKFLLGSWRITPVNRIQTRTFKPITNIRKLVGAGRLTITGDNVDARDCSWFGVPNPAPTTYLINGTLSTAPDYVRTRKDTTRRTRPPGSDQGEFETFSYSLAVPERSVAYIGRSYSYGKAALACAQNPDYWTRTYRTEDQTTVGGCAIFTSSNMVTLQSSVLSETKAAITNRLPQMVARLLPSARRYSIARNIVELRDMPRSVLSLASTLTDLRSAFAVMPRGVQDAFLRARLPQHVPDGWLAFWFSWRQTYKDLVDLLEAPARIGKDINFLLSRKGRPTTLRTKSKVPGVGAATPTFTFNPTNMSGPRFVDTLTKVATRRIWEHEVRLVINLVFDFPEVGLPKLRQELFRRKMGFTITPTDLYNLIPWTWLVDWFTGLGNYVELVDTINTDKSLINWGLVTCVTTGQVITEGTCKYHNVSITTTEGVSTTESVPVERVYSAVLDYKCQVRKDVGDMMGVARTVEPSSLTTYQQSIVGAILARRSV